MKILREKINLDHGSTNSFSSLKNMTYKAISNMRLRNQRERRKRPSTRRISSNSRGS